MNIWGASQAGYIIGIAFCGSFVKKEAQVYFNPMLEIYDRKSVETAEFSLRQGASKQIISTLRLRAKRSKHGWKKMHLGKSMMEM